MTKVGGEGVSRLSDFFAEIAREREAQIELNRRFIKLGLVEEGGVRSSVFEAVSTQRIAIRKERWATSLDYEVSYAIALGALLEKHAVGVTDAVEIGALWEIGYGRRLREIVRGQIVSIDPPQASPV